MYLYMRMWNFNSIDCLKNKLQHYHCLCPVFEALKQSGKNKPQTLSKCQTCARSRMGELRKGCSRAGGLHIHMHALGWFRAQNSAHATFYIFYLLNRPLGKQFSETHENQRELRAQALPVQVSSCNPAGVKTSWWTLFPHCAHQWEIREKSLRWQEQEETHDEPSDKNIFSELCCLLATGPVQDWPLVPAVLSGQQLLQQSHPHHGTSVQNYTPEHFFFFFFFPPGCRLKAALCSEQAGPCPQHPNPTYLMPEPWCDGQQYRGITKRSGRDRLRPNLPMRRFSFTLWGITAEGFT